RSGSGTARTGGSELTPSRYRHGQERLSPVRPRVRPGARALLGYLVRVFARSEVERSFQDPSEVLLLDRQRPIGELGDGVVAGALVQLPHDRPVPDLSRLGHRQELEAVECVLLALQVGLHHLRGLLLGFARRVEDRRLLAVELARDLVQRSTVSLASSPICSSVPARSCSSSSSMPLTVSVAPFAASASPSTSASLLSRFVSSAIVPPAGCG